MSVDLDRWESAVRQDQLGAAASLEELDGDHRRRFKSVYSPELVGGDVVFTNYDLVATNEVT